MAVDQGTAGCGLGRPAGPAVPCFAWLPVQKKDGGEHRGTGQEYERHDVAALSAAGRAGCCADAAAACRRRITARERFVSLRRRP